VGGEGGDLVAKAVEVGRGAGHAGKRHEQFLLLVE